MKLHYKSFGTGRPIIILHGLFGMLDNWRTIAKKLEENYQCIIVDLRNHGKSPHDAAMNYKVMSEDILELMDDLKINVASVLGHSMGGKVAMQFALTHQERIDKLIVVDISPAPYPPHHHAVIEAIRTLETSTLKERSEAESHFRDHLGEDEATIQFLLKSLSRRPDHGFEWKSNMPVIIVHYNDLMEGVTGSNPYEKPALFIRGALSNSVKEENWPQIQQLFPHTVLVTIEKAGHWVHADQPGALIEAINTFMES